MVLNYIWIAFFVIAFLIALVKLIFMGDTSVFPAMMDSTFTSSKTAFEISIGLTGVLALWLGIMKIGERGGVVNLLAKMLAPVFSKLFPDIPKGHPATGSIFMNIAANMLGLDNAATPLGLKAMEQMQELNDKKDTASNPMIMSVGIFIAWQSSWRGSSASITSWGVSVLLALYSGYIWLRNVPPGGSKATAR